MATDDSRPPVTGYPAPPPGTYSGYQPTHPYSYAAPPPQYINNHYQTNPPPHRRRKFLRYFLIAIITFFIVFGAIVLIFWLTVRPQFPGFRIESFAVTNFSAADSEHVSGTWRIGFHVANPNKKMKISYGTLDASLFYKYEFIAGTRISPFAQDTGSETDLDATVNAANAYVAAYAVSDMNSDRNRGSVQFRLRIFGWARLSPKWWYARTRLLRVWCDDLPVGLTSSSNGSGKLLGAARQCSVSL